MNIQLTAHFETFIAAANALENQAHDFEELNEHAYNGHNTRLTHKVESLRRLALSINSQIHEHLQGGSK